MSSAGASKAAFSAGASAADSSAGASTASSAGVSAMSSAGTSSAVASIISATGSSTGATTASTAGAAAAASAASLASFRRSRALALGADFLGVSRYTGIGASSAWPRKRATRSVGCAPTDSQCLMRSAFSVMRFG